MSVGQPNFFASCSPGCDAAGLSCNAGYALNGCADGHYETRHCASCWPSTGTCTGAQSRECTQCTGGSVTDWGSGTTRYTGRYVISMCVASGTDSNT